MEFRLIMRKFIVSVKKSPASIIEVEVEIVKALEDPSIIWALYPGEYKARIIKPTTFYQKFEKNVGGKFELFSIPEIWHSHSFFDSLEDAKFHANELILNSFEFNLRKHGVIFSEEDVQNQINLIEVLML
jgi:hypothetical protein